MPELSGRIRGIVHEGGDGWAVHYRAAKMRAAGQPVTMLSVGDHDIKTARQVLDAMDASARGGNLGYTAVALSDSPAANEFIDFMKTNRDAKNLLRELGWLDPS